MRKRLDTVDTARYKHIKKYNKHLKASLRVARERRKPKGERERADSSDLRCTQGIKRCSCSVPAAGFRALGDWPVTMHNLWGGK